MAQPHTVQYNDHSLTAQMERDVMHLADQVRYNGYMPASPDYAWYTPHWIRDSSRVAISLFDYSASQSGSNPRLATLAHSAAKRINQFHASVLDRYSANMERAVELTLEERDKPVFNSLRSHPPARVDEAGRLYYRKLAAADGSPWIVDDRQQLYTDSWLRQYDTVPLALMAMERETRGFGNGGVGSEVADFLASRGELLANYMGKIYMTPCANAWEEHNNYIHAYDIGAIHSGFKSLKHFAAEGVVPLSKDEIDRAAGLYSGRGGRGPVGFLRKHVVGGVLTRRRKPFVDGMWEGVDGEELFIFNQFGIGDNELGQGVERATMDRIDADLFNGNMAGIRNLDDVYYEGGRWLILMFERGVHAARRGNPEPVREQIDYATAKYGDSLPEQEIVNPAHPESASGRRDLERNGGRPIQRLAWSYAARINATLALLDADGSQEADGYLMAFERA